MELKDIKTLDMSSYSVKPEKKVSMVTAAGMEHPVKFVKRTPETLHLDKLQKNRRDALLQACVQYASKVLNHTELFTKAPDYFEIGKLFCLSKLANPDYFVAYVDSRDSKFVRLCYRIDGISFIDRVDPYELLTSDMKTRFSDNRVEVYRWYLYIVNCLTYFNTVMTRFINIDRMDILEKEDEAELPLHEFSYLFMDTYYPDVIKGKYPQYYSDDVCSYNADTGKFVIIKDHPFYQDISLPALDMAGIEKKLYALYKRLLNTCLYVGADTETTGLDVFDAKLVSLGLTFDTKLGFYLSFGHMYPDTHYSVVGEQGVITYLASLDRNIYPIKNAARYMKYYGNSANNLSKEYLMYITDWLMKAKSIWHNAKYDWNTMLTATGKRIPIFMDTMLAHYVVRPGYDIPQRDKRGLKVIAPKELEIPSWKMDITKCQTEIKDVAAAYNARDTCYMFAIALLLSVDVYKNWDLFQVEMNYLPVLTEAERTGIAIDAEKLKGIEVNLREKADKIKQDFNSMFSPDEEFNINSTPMLKTLFFDKWQIVPPRKCMKCGRRHQEPHFMCVNPECENYNQPDTAPLEFVTDKGEPKLDRYVLQALAQTGSEKAKDLMEYRAATKLLSAYCNLPTKVHHYDNMLHPTYVQNGTATGRVSSKEPNFFVHTLEILKSIELLELPKDYSTTTQMETSIVMV